MFLLAVGVGGVGYRAVYGDAPMSLLNFYEFQHMQRRMAQMQSEEGRKDLEIEAEMDFALELEEQERQGLVKRERAAPPPFDPAVMTDSEVKAWLAKYGN